MKANKNREFITRDKYLTDFDVTLAGRAFTLVLDDGEEYCVNFLNSSALMWAKRGDPFRCEKYACLEADEKTYFVNFELTGVQVRTCVTLILDTEQSLVTAAVARMGVYPRRPRLVTNEFLFGAIKADGIELPLKRHSFTSELVGKQITWTYANGFINTHLYVSENYYRIRTLREADNAVPTSPDEPLFEEPSRFIKIKDGIYLASFIEDNLNKRDRFRGGNNLMILINTYEGFDVGRTFLRNTEQKDEGGMFIAYGEFTDEYIEKAHRPSPYRD